MKKYYNTETGEKIVEPFAKSNAKIPKKCQLQKPDIKPSLSVYKNNIKKNLIFEVTTSVKNIKMRCKQSDIVNISCCGNKSVIRDINNKMHFVTEDEFDQIFKDMKIRYSEINIMYWDKIDAYDYVPPKNDYKIYTLEGKK